MTTEDLNHWRPQDGGAATILWIVVKWFSVWMANCEIHFLLAHLRLLWIIYISYNVSVGQKKNKQERERSQTWPGNLPTRHTIWDQAGSCRSLVCKWEGVCVYMCVCLYGQRGPPSPQFPFFQLLNPAESKQQETNAIAIARMEGCQRVTNTNEAIKSYVFWILKKIPV